MSEAVVAELVDVLGSGSSVHWTWAFESPQLPPTILRKSIPTQSLVNTYLNNLYTFPSYFKTVTKTVTKIISIKLNSSSFKY